MHFNMMLKHLVISKLIKHCFIILEQKVISQN
jgi:hypothetical protein